MAKLPLEIEWGAQLSDLKHGQYQNLLGLATLIELLIEAGILSRSEIAAKAKELDRLFGLPEANESDSSTDRNESMSIFR